jgi:Ca2+-binding RTX toxin-like protein
MNDNDTLNGMAEEDYIFGGAGADTIIGGADGDYLYGDAGADEFNVGATDIADYADDVIDGGSEIDTIDYSTIDTSGFDSGSPTVNSLGIEVVLQAGSAANVFIDGADSSDPTNAHHTLTNVENIIGTNLKDIITGDTQANTLTGMAGNDTLKGNALSDTLLGGDDQDELWGEEGSDRIDGGDHADVIYGGSGYDDLRGDEGDDQISGGGDDDKIFGGADNDSISGGVGKDTLQGEGGDDTLTGDAGDDIVAGGTVTIAAGTVTASSDDDDTLGDTVDYSTALKGMTIDLDIDDAIVGKGTATSADQGDDQLYDIENAIGSNLEGDTIHGSGEANKLEGKGGEDTLYGEDGIDHLIGGADGDILYGDDDIGDSDDGSVDTLEGEAGDDTLYGGDGNDEIDGGTGDDLIVATADDDGADIIDGGDDSDTIDYSALTGATNRIVATLHEDANTDTTVEVYDDTEANSTANDDSDDVNVATNDDTIQDIENIIGTSGNDTFTGNTKSNTLAGGAGTDTVNYNYTAIHADGVMVDLHNDIAKEGAGRLVEDTITDIENVVGSNYDDSFITKEGVNNVIDAGEGSENDGDTVDYSTNNATKVVLDLNAMDGANFATATVSDNDSQDKLKDIENVIGTAGEDVISGSSDVNTIKGGASKDILDGRGDDDTIYGEDGDDTITGGTGADELYGNDGDDLFNGTVAFTGDIIDGGDDSSSGDTVDYSQLTGLTNGVTVELKEGTTVATVEVDGTTNDHTIQNIENIYGTNFADDITGNSSKNTLFGNDGVDNISGGAGNDIIDGGSNTGGTETLLGGVGLDTIYGGDGVDFIDGGTEADIIYGDDSLNSAGMVNDDTIYGGAGEDIIYGGYGDDTLIGGADDDKLKGGAGSDTADYSGSSNFVQANIGNSFAVGSAIGTDTFELIENITGSDVSGVSDQIIGDGNDNTLKGLAGDDTLSEGGGTDFVEGGANNDTIIAGAGDDHIDGDNALAATDNGAAQGNMTFTYDDVILKESTYYRYNNKLEDDTFVVDCTKDYVADIDWIEYTIGTSDTVDYSNIDIGDDTGDTRDVDGSGIDDGVTDAYKGIEIDLSV